MAFTQADLDTIDRAIKTGTTRVTVEGKTVEYRSLDDLLRLRDTIRRSISPPGPGTTRHHPIYRKGL